MLGHYSIRDGNNPELRMLRADYAKSVEQVYTDVAARALVGDKESLITLAAVQHNSLPPSRDFASGGSHRPHSTSNRMPSWVPDWRIQLSYILSEPTSPHQACGSTIPQLNINPTSNVLSIHGIRIDVVDACSGMLARKRIPHRPHCDTRACYRDTVAEVYVKRPSLTSRTNTSPGVAASSPTLRP